MNKGSYRTHLSVIMSLCVDLLFRILELQIYCEGDTLIQVRKYENILQLVNVKLIIHGMGVVEQLVFHPLTKIRIFVF